MLRIVVVSRSSGAIGCGVDNATEGRNGKDEDNTIDLSDGVCGGRKLM